MTAWHQDVEAVRGRPSCCEHCGTSERRMYHWANVSGRYDDIYDYIRLCVPCHSKFDMSDSKKDQQPILGLVSTPSTNNQVKGERHPKAKLTEADVLEIRKRCEAGEGPKAISEDYPVAPSVISNIKARNIWKHI